MEYLLKFNVEINGKSKELNLGTNDLDSSLLVIFQCLKNNGDSVKIKMNDGTTDFNGDEAEFKMIGGDVISANPEDQEKLICNALNVMRHGSVKNEEKLSKKEKTK